MSDQDTQILAFNRGVLDSIGLARIDIERYSFAAALQRNWMPRVLGSMQLRPGMQYLDSCYEDLQLVRQMPFIFDEDDTALLEINTGAIMRVRVNDELLVRPTVATTITNNNFAVDPDNTSPPTGWTIDDDANCDSFVLNLNLELRGSGEGFARCYQTVTVAPADQGVEHGLRIGVGKGGVLCRIGSTVQGEEYVREFLDPGTHHLSITPTGDFTIEFSNDKEFNSIVSSCRIETGDVLLVTPWGSEDDVGSLRWEQSGDRIYVAADGPFPRVIERRGDRSWSIGSYTARVNNGPFKILNTSAITLRPTALQGDYDPFGGGIWVELIAESDGNPAEFFTSQDNGMLFRLQSEGQTVTNTQGSATDVVTLPVRVTGSDEARRIGIIIEGTFVSRAYLQFAFSETGPWNDVGGQEWTSPISTSYSDGQDGQVIFYRLRADAADYTSGNLTMTITYTGGTRQGICRIREVVSGSVARIGILEPFGSIEATKDWWKGQWGSSEKLPNSVAIHEGRLWWGGEDRIWGSVSDEFENFDDNTEGDSAPINRTIGAGPIRKINWFLSMARLLMGTSDNSADIAAQKLDGNNPLSARSTNFDEPLTPFNFNIKTAGSRGVFVDRTRQRLFELVYDIDIQDFKPQDLSIFTPSFNRIGIRQIAVQMKPDIRVHCVRDDGTVGIFVYDRTENVMAWVDVELGGVGNWCVEDVAVLPGTVEDQVYYTVKSFNGISGEERYLLKWSLEEEATGGLNNYMLDAWFQYDGAPTDVVSGVDHLAGLTVGVWADGAYVGDTQVSQFGTPGEVDLSDLTLDGEPNTALQSSNVIVGLKYTARFQSTKLATLQRIGLMEHKKVNKLGFIAENLHHKGIQYGPDFDNLYDLPAVEEGQVVAADFIWDEYHEENFPFGGEWDVDSRICLQGESPKPATILAAIAEFQSVEKMRRE